MENSPISGLLQLSTYREQRQHVFPSQSSLDWFLRKHREALIAHGALLLLAGRWFAAADRFDDYMLLAGTEAAKRRT
jgi:hypothetical protein